MHYHFCMWQKLLKELHEKGYSDTQIASTIGCNQSTISRLRRGKTENAHYTIGEGILSLHKKAARQELKRAANGS